MIRPGLTSITFRKFSPRTVVEWAAKAGLEGIEWGGDIHVPHGDLDAAREAARRTADAGLVVSSYGSYCRMGAEQTGFLDRVLETAVTLGAPMVRVWAGKRGSDKATEEYRRRVVADAVRVAEKAAAAGLRIVTEWHANTLTDTAESAAALLEAVGHEAFGTYWQPRQGSAEANLRDMDAALPRLAGLHVFHWDAETNQRRPLEEGGAAWRQYLAKAATAGDMFALLEFVRDDDPRQLLADAADLRKWLADLNAA